MSVTDDVKGWVFDIQRYSIHDGPGIRTTVFFKGCPLRCLWCDNPESQKPSPELLFFESLCQRCYRCVRVCLSGATTVGNDGAILIDRSKCTGCGRCVEQCPGEARVLSGKQMTAAEVVEVVKKDTLFTLIPEVVSPPPAGSLSTSRSFLRRFSVFAVSWGYIPRWRHRARQNGR